MNSWFQRVIDWGADRSVILAIFVLNITALCKYWAPIKARRNERLRDIDKQKSGDWERLRARITRLEERCDKLQQEVDECRQREGEWMKRAMISEGYQLGRGNFRQDLTILESNERVKKDKEK